MCVGKVCRESDTESPHCLVYALSTFGNDLGCPVILPTVISFSPSLGGDGWTTRIQSEVAFSSMCESQVVVLIDVYGGTALHYNESSSLCIHHY